MDYRTRILHTGKDIDPYTGAASIPIYTASTFVQKDPDEFGEYEYSRGKNPTREALEHTISELESGYRGFAFSSGMAAISSVFLLFRPGDHIVVSTDVYGGTYRILTTLFTQWGLKSSFVDTTDINAVLAAITPVTKAIFIETPSNPVLKITDISEIAAIAKDRKLLSIIDNTFMTPYLQRPLELGIDITIHSATKFLGGHSDLIAGAVAVKDKDIASGIKQIQTAFGAILSPFDSWLMLRGIKTLGARIEAEQKTAEDIAFWLPEQPEIKKVYYPALPGHPGKDIHFKQSSGGGAVVSFELEDEKKAREFLRNIELSLFAVSLGGVESIISYPATMSHSAMPRQERLARGISDGLVRLSVGLESADDIKKDIRQALDAAGGKV
jgi:cysteine-S-conjugate beta-lyase